MPFEKVVKFEASVRDSENLRGRNSDG